LINSEGIAETLMRLRLVKSESSSMK